MKLILSRKGFDTANGGCPSPIFPDGTMFSLPIPQNDKITYGELSHVSERLGKVNIGDVVQDLTMRRRKRTKYGPADHCHLDPDLNFHAYPRQEGWRGLFGQADARETELMNEKVGDGDLFLFFGLYRWVEKKGDLWRFVPKTRPVHILWGWLQIGEIYAQLHESDQLMIPWASHHPHLLYGPEKNTLYVASDTLDLGDSPPSSDVPGWGVFPKFKEGLVLTLNGQSASHWRLPRWFYPDGDKQPLGHHRDRSRILKSPYMSPDPWEPCWKPDNDDYAYLESVGLGQEFVLNLDEYPKDEYIEAVDWARGLIRDLGAR